MPHFIYVWSFLLLLKCFYFLDHGPPTRSSPRKRIPADADNINNGNDSSDDENILDYSSDDFRDSDAQKDDGHNVKLVEEKAVWSNPDVFIMLTLNMLWYM